MTEYTRQLGVETQKKNPNYLAVFGVLAVITLIEVTVASQLPALLVALSLSKAALVALYYMHLKFESGWFSAIFLLPIPFVLMITVALIAALAPASSPDAAAAAASVCTFF